MSKQIVLTGVFIDNQTVEKFGSPSDLKLGRPSKRSEVRKRYLLVFNDTIEIPVAEEVFQAVFAEWDSGENHPEFSETPDGAEVFGAQDDSIPPPPEDWGGQEDDGVSQV